MEAHSTSSVHPDLGNLLYQEYENSNYHSLQATFQPPDGKSLRFYATYTFSKVSVRSQVTRLLPIPSMPVAAATASSITIVRHIFNLSYNY